MSEAKQSDKKKLKPRKKGKFNKRPPTSPLDNSDQPCQTGLDSTQSTQSVTQGKNTNTNVNDNFASGYCRSFPFTTDRTMAFSQQTPFQLQQPNFFGSQNSQSPPTQPMQYPTQYPSQYGAQPPPWAKEILDDIKQMKQSLLKIDKIEKTVDSIAIKVSDLDQRVKGMDERLTDVEKCCSFISDETDKGKSDLNAAKNEISTLKKKCENLEQKSKVIEDLNKELDDKIVDLEARSMRENLVFHGIKEEGTNENCEELVKKLCQEKLEMENADDLRFDRAHRIGAKQGGKTRPIVVKFHYYSDREAVRKRSYDFSENLQGDNLRIAPQWPKKIRDARRELYPIMEKERASGKSVKMIKDKLFVNGQQYHMKASDKKEKASENMEH